MGYNNSMKKVSVIFFGSFLHYSTKVAAALLAFPLIDLLAVVTTEAKRAGKNNVLKYTHTELWAKENNIKVFTPKDLSKSSPKDLSIPKPDYFLSAGFGKLLPTSWLKYPKYHSLNLHFSLLPDYKGANPAEWAILLGEKETGVSLIQMTSKYDTGNVITRKPYPMGKDATRETLYEPLYTLASQIARESLLDCKDLSFATPQNKSDKPYAKRFTRSQGFIDWQFVSQALLGKFPKNPSSFLSENLKTAWEYLFNHPNESDGIITPEVFIERATRALSGFPDVWTYIPTKNGKKRLKILQTSINNGILTLDQVQVEGKSPSTFNQIKNIINF
jgi:methionyl-tRNA formyltransferase